MDTITHQVNRLYESYPYPYSDVKSELLMDLYILVHMLLAETGIDDDEIAGFNFFDAGCGTGQRVLGLASQFPRARFTCIDMTEASLEIAKRQAQKQGIQNVTFRRKNILELDETGNYDVVTSMGVIHHLSDPARGVRNLVPLLAPNGLLVIHIYHTLGEYQRLLQRELTRLLVMDEDLEYGIKTMRDLGFSLSEQYYGQHGYNSDLTDGDHISKDVDVYLHPRVCTYRFAEGVDLFRSSGLDWVAINSVNTPTNSYFISSTMPTDSLAFDPCDILNTDHLQTAYERLPLEKKLQVLEILLKPTAFSLVAGRDGALGRIGARLHHNLIRLG